MRFELLIKLDGVLLQFWATLGSPFHGVHAAQPACQVETRSEFGTLDQQTRLFQPALVK